MAQEGSFLGSPWGLGQVRVQVEVGSEVQDPAGGAGPGTGCDSPSASSGTWQWGGMGQGLGGSSSSGAGAPGRTGHCPEAAGPAQGAGDIGACPCPGARKALLAAGHVERRLLRKGAGPAGPARPRGGDGAGKGEFGCPGAPSPPGLRQRGISGSAGLTWPGHARLCQRLLFPLGACGLRDR